MANNNLQIPGISYMSYTPDVHVGVGTCIGTTAVWDAQDGYVSPSIVGSDIGCGMRVHMTNLHKDDLKDVKLRRKLVKAIEKVLPMEANQRGHYSDLRLEHIVRKGLHGLPKNTFRTAIRPKIDLPNPCGKQQVCFRRGGIEPCARYDLASVASSAWHARRRKSFCRNSGD